MPPLTSVFIEPREAGCLVTIHHAGFPSGRSGAAAYDLAGGLWRDCLGRLRARFGGAPA
jgi:hypothetical protein